MGDIANARAKVKAAITAVTDTLTMQERAEWLRELEHLRAVEASLTNRLNVRERLKREACGEKRA